MGGASGNGLPLKGRSNGITKDADWLMNAPPGGIRIGEKQKLRLEQALVTQTGVALSR